MQSIYLLIKDEFLVGHKSVWFFSHRISFLCAAVHSSENSDICHEFIVSFKFVHMQTCWEVKEMLGLCLGNIKVWFMLQEAL